MKLIKNILVYTIVINIIKSISISSKWDKADTLSQDERIESPNGTYFAIIQNDGNFVVYSKKGKNGKRRPNRLLSTQVFCKEWRMTGGRND